MEVLKVYPKDVYTDVSFSTEQLDFILEYLDNCEARLNLKDDYHRKCNEYVTKVFFPKLQALSNDIQQMR